MVELYRGDSLMKKLLLSLIGGILIGGIISYLILDYKNSNYVILNYFGVDKKTVREWDFQFISNAGFIIAGVSISIYLIWTFFEKKSKNIE
jgi:phage shock protein PspC (stress-responsive transcriptional regulator)